MGDRGFWAYHAALSVVLLRLVELVEAETDPEWLVQGVPQWRRSAGLPDHALRFPSEWSSEQRDVLISHLSTVRSFLLAGPLMPADLNALHAFADAPPLVTWLGPDPISPLPFVQIIDGMVQLLTDTLPAVADAEAWWYFGVDDGPPRLI